METPLDILYKKRKAEHEELVKALSICLIIVIMMEVFAFLKETLNVQLH
jgi:hypothetical protein